MHKHLYFLDIFFFLAGLLYLLEYFQFIPVVQWGLPLFFTCLGFTGLYNTFMVSKSESHNSRNKNYNAFLLEDKLSNK